MSIFELHIKDLEITSESKFATWGIIYFQFDDLCFPDDMWYDAVSSLLDMWVYILDDFLCTDEKQCDLPFMDGPYEIQLIKDESEHIVMFCKSDDAIIAEYKIRVIDLINNIDTAVLKLLDHLDGTASRNVITKKQRQLLSNHKTLLNIKNNAGQGDGSLVPSP